jgi:hypothetical protein
MPSFISLLHLATYVFLMASESTAMLSLNCSLVLVLYSMAHNVSRECDRAVSQTSFPIAQYANLCRLAPWSMLLALTPPRGHPLQFPPSLIDCHK